MKKNEKLSNFTFLFVPCKKNKKLLNRIWLALNCIWLALDCIWLATLRVECRTLFWLVCHSFLSLFENSWLCLKQKGVLKCCQPNAISLVLELLLNKQNKFFHFLTIFQERKRKLKMKKGKVNEKLWKQNEKLSNFHFFVLTKRIQK